MPDTNFQRMNTEQDLVKSTNNVLNRKVLDKLKFFNSFKLKKLVKFKAMSTTISPNVGDLTPNDNDLQGKF